MCLYVDRNIQRNQKENGKKMEQNMQMKVPESKILDSKRKGTRIYKYSFKRYSCIFKS